MIRNIFNILILAVCVALSIKALAQNRPDDRDYVNRSNPGVSAGGNWTVDRSEDRMTAEKRTRFELQADNTRNSDERARIILYCTDGKLKLADFNPNLRLSRPNWAGFWGQPQMRVMVRVDDAHSYHGWNWIRGRFLSVDKGTTRELIGAHIFKVEIRGRNGPEIAEFSPAGLDLDRVKQACDLTPKRPSKD